MPRDEPTGPRVSSRTAAVLAALALTLGACAPGYCFDPVLRFDLAPVGGGHAAVVRADESTTPSTVAPTVRP